MNARERVLRTVNHQEVDRIAIDWNDASDNLKAGVMRYYGAKNYNELMVALHSDIRRLSPLEYVGPQRYVGDEPADFWGVTQRAMDDGDSSDECPFAFVESVDEVEAYQWPKIEDFVDKDHRIEKEIEMYDDYAIHAAVWGGVYHNYIWMCGFENSLIYLHTQPDVAKAILRHITDFWLDYARKVLEIGRGRIDICDSFNDFGTQIGLIMSPQMLEEFVLVNLKKYYTQVHNYGAKAYHHSCGSVESVVPNLVAAGVDILDPIQVSATGMSLENLRAKYGPTITFHGGIDTQHVMPEGTEEEVRQAIRDAKNLFGTGGGYILAGSQKFEDDISVQNVVAMYDEAWK